MTTLLFRIRVLLAAVVVCAPALLVATPVSAGAATSNGGVYGILARQDGWCSNPSISWENYTTGDRGSDTTRTDDIFWLRVRLGTSNNVEVYTSCLGKIWSGNIKPARNGQSVFFRWPSGATIK